MKKVLKGMIVSVFVCVSFCLIACGGAKPKTFTSDAGISITLTDVFYEKSMVSQTLYLESQKAIFVALKEDFSSFSNLGYNTESMTLMDYANLVISNNKLDVSATENDGLVSFNYSKDVSGKDFYYKAYVFKGSDAFWLCQFACENSNKNTYDDQFNTWAKTIKIN